MTRRLVAITVLVAACGTATTRGGTPAGQSAAPVAATQPAGVMPHDSFTLRSTALDEARRVNVYLPPKYRADGAQRFPVLYMPDGGVDEDFTHVAATVESLIASGRIRPVLLVGIPNTQRRRDLTGPTRFREDSAIAPRVGGSAAFRDFLARELIPSIEQRYRVTSERGIVGESLAGLFIVETFLRTPALFTHYVALDPSVWWNGGALVDSAAALLRTRGVPAGTTLFLANSDEPVIATGTARLVDSLRAVAPAGLRWSHEAHPELTHGTIYRGLEVKSLADALR